MIKKTVLVALLIFIIIALFGLRKLNENSLLLWNANHISIMAEPPLNKNKVNIEYGHGVNTINRKNDLDLFNDRKKYTIIYDGKITHEMPNDYGENDFLITYDDTYYAFFRHYKSNRRHQHDYEFSLRKEDEDILLKVTINGIDQDTIRTKMLKIDSLKNLDIY